MHTHITKPGKPDRRVQLISGLYPLLWPIRGIISQDRCPANVDRQLLLAGALQNAAAALCEMIFLPPSELSEIRCARRGIALKWSCARAVATRAIGRVPVHSQPQQQRPRQAFSVSDRFPCGREDKQQEPALKQLELCVNRLRAHLLFRQSRLKRQQRSYNGSRKNSSGKQKGREARS